MCTECWRPAHWRETGECVLASLSFYLFGMLETTHTSRTQRHALPVISPAHDGAPIPVFSSAHGMAEIRPWDCVRAIHDVQASGFRLHNPLSLTLNFSTPENTHTPHNDTQTIPRSRPRMTYCRNPTLGLCASDSRRPSCGISTTSRASTRLGSAARPWRASPTSPTSPSPPAQSRTRAHGSMCTECVLRALVYRLCCSCDVDTCVVIAHKDGIVRVGIGVHLWLSVSRACRSGPLRMDWEQMWWGCRGNG